MCLLVMSAVLTCHDCICLLVILCLLAFLLASHLVLRWLACHLVFRWLTCHLVLRWLACHLVLRWLALRACVALACLLVIVVFARCVLACHVFVGSPFFVHVACLCCVTCCVSLSCFVVRVCLCLLGMLVFPRHVLRFDLS